MPKKHREIELHELDLAPIMNMVMILIPLLLVTATFVTVNTLNVTSPQQATAITPSEPEEEEEVPVPRLMVAISEEGFTVNDMRQSPHFAESLLSQPVEGCPRPPDPTVVAVTICNESTQIGEDELLRQLNFRGLYNRLVEIRNYSAWSAQWDDSNDIINIVADRDVPFEVVVRTMDVARFFLVNDAYPSEEGFRTAVYRAEGDSGAPVRLFPSPVLLLPRPAAD